MACAEGQEIGPRDTAAADALHLCAAESKSQAVLALFGGLGMSCISLSHVKAKPAQGQAGLLYIFAPIGAMRVG